MNIPRQNLRTPGPTPVPDDIMDIMTAPMIDHRGPEFFDIIMQATDGLKQVFATQNDLFILTASGTGGLESLIVNSLSRGDRGAFRHRRFLRRPVLRDGRSLRRGRAAAGFRVGRSGGPGRCARRPERRPEHQGGACDPQRDLHRRHPPAARNLPGGEGRVQQAAAGGRGEQPGLPAPARGRLELRPGGHRVPEGVYDSAGAGLRQRQPGGLGSRGGGRHAPLLLRLAGRQRLPGAGARPPSRPTWPCSTV